MSQHAASGGTGRWQDQQATNVPRPPAEALAGNRRGKARLLVELPQRRFGGGQVGLDLEHENDVLSEREDVVRATLAEVRVSDLWLYVPTIGGEPSGDRGDEDRMVLVEKAIQGACSPPDAQDSRRVEGREDAVDAAQGDRIEMASLHYGDRLLRAPRRTREVDLAPAAPASQRTHDAPDSLTVHGAIVGATTYLTLTGRTIADGAGRRRAERGAA